MVDIQTARIREPTRRRQSTTAPRSGTYEGESREVAHRRKRQSLPQIPRDYLDRRELLELVPLSMSTIDTLEKKGEFPSRFVLSPTVKVCWRRHEAEKWLAERARKRVHQGLKPDDVIERKGRGGETIDDLVAWPTAKPDAPSSGYLPTEGRRSWRMTTT